MNDNIDKALEKVLKAAGTKLDNYMPSTKDALREAMRQVMSESYITGSNNCLEAIRAK